MYHPNNDLALEDLFEIVTPTGVTTRINNLLAAWGKLYNDNPNDQLVLSELSNYSAWKDSIDESYLSKIFATGTLNELDSWLKRYTTAYNLSKVKTNSPVPIDITLEKPDITKYIPSIVFVLGLCGVAYLASEAITIFKLVKK